MARVLYITANPKPVQESISLTVGREFLKAYKVAKPDDQVTELDVYRTNIPIIDADVFTGWGKLAQGKQFDDLISEEQAKVGRISELTDQFMAADKYIFVTPLWNLSVPPRMKAYIDCICIAGKTFKYTAEGPVGLMKGKKAVHIQARGGFYTEGPAKDLEFGDRYLRALLSFLGVGPIETVVAEGQDYAHDQREAIIAKAIEDAKQAAKRFAE